MKYVEIYKLVITNQPEQKVIARCELHGDEVICTGDSALVENIQREGVHNYGANAAEKPTLFPGDGLVFLEQLSSHFRSGYINASDVKESPGSSGDILQ